MSRDQQRLDDYLAHIVEAIERITRYTADMDETAFVNDQLVQDAVIRNLEIIGDPACTSAFRKCGQCTAPETAKGGSGKRPGMHQASHGLLLSKAPAAAPAAAPAPAAHR